MAQLFETWTFRGVRHVAFPVHGADIEAAPVIVLDESGQNFGSWQSVERFRKRQQDDVEENNLARIPCGRVSGVGVRIFQ